MSDANVVIIGGGIMGVSLLYHLTEMGWRDAVLVEKNELTSGSTWHAAGLCTHFAHNPAIQELRAASVRLYRDILPAQTGVPVGFHRSGAMRITRSRRRMDEFAHVAGLSRFTGYDLEVLTPARIEELYPLARLDGVRGGIYEPDDGHVDPASATRALAQMAQRQGGTILRRNPVRAIAREANGFRIEVEKGVIRTRHVVNAAGAWGFEVGRMMGLEIPSVPILHQYVVTGGVAEIAARMAAGAPELPIIRDPEESWYVRQEGDGFILGAYETAARPWSVDAMPPGFGAELLPPDLERIEPILEAAMERIPALAGCGVKTVVNGPITFTPDANPLIGPAHGIPNGWLLTASSMGVMEGGGAGWFLARWMTQGAPPMDALAVDPRRFGAWADRAYRIEKAVECFGLQFGVHYPAEERPAARNKRLSPLHDLLLARGAVMGVVNGWERPNWFSDRAGAQSTVGFGRANWFEPVGREVRTVTTHAGLADLSALSKFEVTGADARAFVDSLGANPAPRNGRIGLIHTLTPDGGVLSEFTVAMLSDTHAYLTSAAAAEQIDWDGLLRHAASFDVRLANITDAFGAIGVMGANSRALLGALTAEDPDLGFDWLSVRTIRVAGLPVRALRVSYIGEPGWELHLPMDGMRALFMALEEAGHKHGCGKPGYYGAYAANAMRIEKGYRSWGGDLTTERTPAEAGLGHLIRPDGRVFAGKDALLARMADADAWEMCLFEVEGAGVAPFYLHTIFQHDRPVGIITSAAYGHRTGKNLALGYLRAAGIRGGLTAGILGERAKITPLDTPPFDPQNRRLKG